MFAVEFWTFPFNTVGHHLIVLLRVMVRVRAIGERLDEAWAGIVLGQCLLKHAIHGHPILECERS